MGSKVRSVVACAAGAIALFTAPLPADAGVIISPTGATASNTIDGNIARTIDQSGLLVPFVSGVTDFATYVAGNPQHQAPGPANAWSGAASALPINLDFDLGGTFAIGDLALWTSFSGFSINRFVVYIADNAGFVDAFMAGAFDANDTLPVTPQVFDLAAAVGSFLRLQILSNESAGAVNLSEIGVEVSAVPEPGVLALLGLGLAGLAATRRRRQ